LQIRETLYVNHPTQQNHMPTKDIGAGKRNVSVTLTVSEKDTLEKLAEKSGMSRSEYCRAALREYIDSKTYFEKPKKKKG
jgi:hypothetical protein